METTTIKIDGISCMGCVKTLTGVLSGIDGVNQVVVDKDTASASVQFDPAVTGQADFKQAIEDAGYDVV
ncbi:MULTISPECIES: heavy-metal-associated domain-containing protein [Silvimonas]|uniref:heavy-metal-associated domain-containing protein n=1 Tax=Silvimonas TaxID=300264 RepID=UPI0024B3AC42|nr:MULTISPECIES: heavy-metal-associated domain-containing protein [Silvimonas]MDR3428134.1 heavy-metal-associated domain-containing protein [Silvimonas sp.]